MPKQPQKIPLQRSLERFLYVVLYAFVRFFIAVGEGTRFLLLFPFKVLVTGKDALVRLIINLGRFVEKSTSSVLNTIKKLRYPRKPKKVKRIKIQPPRVRFFWKHYFPFRPKRVSGWVKDLFKRPRKQQVPKEQIALFPKKPKRKPLPFLSFRMIYFVIGFATAFAVVFLTQTYEFVKKLPSPRSIGKVNYSLTTHIYDRNGKLLYEIYRDQNRTPIKLSDIPVYDYEASIAIEDKDFFRHNGVSPIGGMVRAIKDTLINKQLQGGSTITQQLVKASLLTPERTISRKVKEIILALWTERLYTKKQILEMYLNQVPYGGSAYGIQEAAKIYFNKSATDLDMSEAAFLAGLPQAPSNYSPYVNPQLAVSRRNDVLRKMYEQKYITQAQYDQALQEELKIAQPKTDIRAPHFVFYTKNELIKQFGPEEVEEGGLKVTTTLDLNIQEKAEQILREELEKVRYLNISNGAILVTRPATGEILAMVGSTDYFATPSGAFNVTTALRQPGSSIKPLMYSLALAKGYTAATPIEDSPVVFTYRGAPSYRPVNYDGKFHGRLPLRYMLANSLNVPAVKTLNSLGVQNFVEQAKRLGISTWDDSSRFGLSLTLGGGDVKMVDMAKAYGTFANLGDKAEISPVLRVTDVTDQTIYQRNPLPIRTLDPGISYILSDILSDNQARQMEFGAHSSLEIPGYKVAVKTGTTDVKKDNWTIGYTPEFLIVVWVGNNDNTPMNQYLASGITGAAPIWNRMMSYLLTNYSQKNTWYSKPDNIVEKPCYGGRVEYFIRGTENKGCQQSFNISPTVTPQP